MIVRYIKKKIESHLNSNNSTYVDTFAQRDMHRNTQRPARSYLGDLSGNLLLKYVFTHRGQSAKLVVQRSRGVLGHGKRVVDQV